MPLITPERIALARKIGFYSIMALSMLYVFTTLDLKPVQAVYEQY